MKIIEDYLRRDLGIAKKLDWSETRRAYLERAAKLVKDDWQSPSYLTSLDDQAGRRKGKITANINDYTRDHHDLSYDYERKFVSQYLPRVSILPIEAYVTSSGMSALMTAITTLHRLHGPDQVVLVGKHSYFQNLEILTKSFTRIILFDEKDCDEWERLIDHHHPTAIFVDSLCNNPELTRPPVDKIAKFWGDQGGELRYLVIDNTMLATKFDWKSVLKFRRKKLQVIGWESLNKYYQFGLDRVMGGILWGSGNLGLHINQARRHAGTILSDISVAMLPTPKRKVMNAYLGRVWSNREILQQIIGSRCIGDGAQVVIRLEENLSYGKIQKIITKIIREANKAKIQVVAGTSFGMPNTRVYLTARQTKYSEMFLRVSVGTEDEQAIRLIAGIIRSCI